MKNARLLPRRPTIRILLVILAIFPLGFVAAAVGSAQDPGAAAVFGALGVALLAVLAFLFVREHTFRVMVADDGVEVTALTPLGKRTRSISFADIEDIRLRVVETNHGVGAHFGLVGIAVSAAVDAMSQPKTGIINENTASVTITLTGAGNVVTLTSNNRDVVSVYQSIVAATRDRLLAAATRRVRGGDVARFGPYTVENNGVRVRGALLAFDEIESFELKSGKLAIKKRGAWFTKAAPLVRSIPNVDVLLALVASMRGRPAEPVVASATQAAASML